MTLLEVKAFLQGVSLGIGDRAPTYEEWKALLEYVEKNTLITAAPNRLPGVYNPPYNPNATILVGGVGSQTFGQVNNTAAKNY